MQEAGLFPHETIHDKQLGTLFIYPEQLGIRSMDLGGKERQAVGGTLFITQFRLLFEAHPLNPIGGYTSVLLDTITQVRDTSAFLKPQITVTAGVPYDYFMFGVTQPLAAIQRVLTRSTPATRTEARNNLMRLYLQNNAGERPPRVTVRAMLDGSVATPSTVMRTMTLYNLWLSLGAV